MSVGRPDPNYIPKFVSPEEYNRNKASIEAARAKLEEYARLNEVAKRNFELKEQEEREERELAQKIQEGELAKQRLLQLRKRRSLAITDGSIAGSSSIENVGDGYVGEITSFQQNSAPYPQSMSQPMRQSTSSYDVSSSYNHPGHIQQPQLYAGSRKISTQPFLPATQTTKVHDTINRSILDSHFLGNNHPILHDIKGIKQRRKTRVLIIPKDPSSSSLVGALGPNPSTTTSSWDAGQASSLPSPLWDISMPASPSVAQLQSIKQYLNQWASSVPPQTHYNATILWDTYVVKCFKNREGIIVFSIETPNGTIEAAAHGILDDLIAKVKPPPQPAVNPSAQMPPTVAQTIQGTSHSSIRAPNPTGHIPSTTSPSATQNNSSAAQNMAVNQTNVAPISQAPTEHIAQTSQQRANPVSVSSSAKSITPNTQVAPPSLPPLLTVSRATTGQSAISSASVTPQGPLTPSKQPSSEQLTPSITPQQADKRRIAQSLLWALGKRPRESPSDTESQSSKKRAIEISQAENSNDEAQTAISAARINSQPDTVPPPHPIDHAGPSKVSQHSNQPSDVSALSTTHSMDVPPTVSSKPFNPGVVENLSTQDSRSTDHRQPSQSNTRLVPNNVTTNPKYHPNVSRSVIPNPKYYPRADYNTFVWKSGEPGSSSQVPSGRVQSATQDEPEKSIPDKLPEHSTHVQSFASTQLASAPTTLLPVSASLSTSSNTHVTLSHPQTVVMPLESEPKEEPQQSSVTSSSQKVVEKFGSDVSNIPVETKPRSTAAHTVRDSQEPGPSASVSSPAPTKSTTSPHYSSVKQTNREPLFLPSSSPESGPSFSQKQSKTPVATVHNANKILKRIEHRAYVMVPPAPDYLVRYREQLRRKQVRVMRDEEEEEPVSLPESTVEEEDCKETFRSGGQLLKHFRKRHADGPLKPSAKPEPPIAEVDVELPDIPEPFPSYLLSTDLACGEVLSEERHRLVGQQVLMNITFVDDGTSLKRRPKKTARPASRTLPDPTARLTSDYQFLVTKDSARSSTYSSKACDINHEDLDSAQISRIIKEGLVLWGSDEENDGGAAEVVAAPPGSPLFSPKPQQQLLDATTATPGYDRSDSGSVHRQPEFDGFHTSDVEDAAVENMLTDVDIDLTLTS
ncbi:hypothetical protein JR316_0004437 [Psilocybe cubensis]|uniref:Uncharacterized protein n=2 Tax=Psilocybe cubensis TaxID=181762 RepID=A0A8H7XXV1_PSICU|nr:hypothetical protein JR316_0004437 [Psilocybe cubensis]KAH9482339.1 hypothetical protein JR316_0004437 [Psilocybe cubensis]